MLVILSFLSSWHILSKVQWFGSCLLNLSVVSNDSCLTYIYIFNDHLVSEIKKGMKKVSAIGLSLQILQLFRGLVLDCIVYKNPQVLLLMSGITGIFG